MTAYLGLALISKRYAPSAEACSDDAANIIPRYSGPLQRLLESDGGRFQQIRTGLADEAA
jgi:hypothetical protein